MYEDRGVIIRWWITWWNISLKLSPWLQDYSRKGIGSVYHIDSGHSSHFCLHCSITTYFLPVNVVIIPSHNQNKLAITNYSSLLLGFKNACALNECLCISVGCSNTPNILNLYLYLIQHWQNPSLFLQGRFSENRPPCLFAFCFTLPAHPYAHVSLCTRITNVHNRLWICFSTMDDFSF